MKKLYEVALFALTLSMAYSQTEYPRGVMIFDQINVDTSQLRTALHANWIQGRVEDGDGTKKDYILLNGSALKVMGYALKDIYPKTRAQEMQYGSLQGPEQDVNYFGTRIGTPDGTSLRRDVGSGVGYMVSDMQPKNEFHYGINNYIAQFSLKCGTGSGDPLAVDLEVVDSVTGNQVVPPTYVYCSQLSTTQFTTIEVPFSLIYNTSRAKTLGTLYGTLAYMPPTDPDTAQYIDVRVKYYNNVSVWLDTVKVCDSLGKALFNGKYDSAITYSAGYFQSHYSLMKRFYFQDEPEKSVYSAQKYVQGLIVNEYGLHSDGTGGTTTAQYKDINRYVLDAQPNELLVDLYSLGADVPSPNFQNNTLADFVGITHWQGAEQYIASLDSNFELGVLKNLRDAAVVAKTYAKNLWFTCQLHGVFYQSNGQFRRPDAGHVGDPDLRVPTGGEVKLMMNLALAYGAKGMLPYPFGTASQAAYRKDATNSYTAYFPGLVSLQVDGNGNYSDHSSNTGYLPYGTGSKSFYVGYKEKFDTVAAMFQWLGNVGPELISLSWIGAKSWNIGKTAGSWSGIVSAVDAKAGTTSDNSPQVETGHLTNSSNVDYVFAVNRRPDTSGTRNILLSLKNTTMEWRVFIVGTTDTSITSDQGVLTKAFGPGEGKLIKILQQGPSVPQNVVVTAVGGVTKHPQISWSKDIPSSTQLPISGYEIYRSDDPSLAGSLLTTTSATDSLYVDNGITTGSASLIYYRLKAKDNSSLHSAYSAQVSIHEKLWIQKHGANPLAAVPTEFALRPNYPNPFNPTTTITFDLPLDVFVTINIYNEIGQEVQTLMSEVKPAGSYSLEWNAANLPSGIYFFRIKAGQFTESRKMILMK